MKRQEALLTLSREHHTALSLARAIRLVEESGDARLLADTAERIVRLFPAALEPHFAKEEAGILVALAEAGETRLVTRTLREHQALRHLAAAIARGRLQRMAMFGRLLAAHVRFEERELFERAQVLWPAGFDRRTEV